MAFFTNRDGVKIFYQCYGKGDVTIIFSPGGGESTKFFFKQAAGLSDQYRVVLYDHRGHGASEMGDRAVNMRAVANDLNDLMDHLELEHAYLAGHSLGAMTILGYADIYGESRIDGLIYMDMSPKAFAVTEDEYPIGWHGESGTDFLTNLLDVNGNKSTGAALVNSVYLDPEEHMIDMAEFLLQEEAVNATPYRLSIDQLTVTADQRELLSQLNTPVLVAYGAAHALYPQSVFDYMESQLKYPTMLPVPGKHYFFIDHAKEFNQGVVDFITKVESEKKRK